MKAIINVHGASCYSKYNGLTFEVKEVYGNIITVLIDGRSVDFSNKEVIIVDFQKELAEAFEKAETSKEKMVLLHHLRTYKIVHKIQETSHH